ncbi:MAG: preprotein translocase subunit SecG [Pyrinomonadaceae bacterium]
MLYILYALFFISCIVLVGSVLLQPGKTDAGALFTSNVSSAAFGPRGTASVLSKMTIASAAIFMLSALLISMPALSGNVSVLQSTAAESPADTPAEAPVSAEQSTAPASANTPVDENANGALIETPATNKFEADANKGTTAPANK